MRTLGKKNEVVLSDGTVLPITNFFDIYGDDCEPDEAVTCVAGTEDFGWITIDLTEYEFATVH